MKDDKDIKIRKATTEVRGIEIVFDEYYKVDPITGEELFDRELEIRNDANVYNIYKKKKGLLTNAEIKEIRNKYKMNQKEYALAIGVGEVTINRFENGAIQTEATDAIMRLSEDPDNMYDLLTKNQDNIPNSVYENFVAEVNSMRELKSHKIADYDKEKIISLNFKTAEIKDVAEAVIKKYNKKYEKLNEQYKIDTNSEYITQLKLQKLLYYIQGMSLSIFGKPAFESKIYAWSYGPVVEEVYKKYKSKGKKAIETPTNIKSISKGLSSVIDIVIEGYGKYTAESLVDLTHAEEPWKKTKINEEITQDNIKDYFEKVYK